MSHPKLVVVLASTLILISLLGRAVPTTSAAPGRFALQTREQEQIDTYIHTRSSFLDTGRGLLELDERAICHKTSDKY